MFLFEMNDALGKLGVSGIDSNLATAIRTVVILFIARAIAVGTARQARYVQSQPDARCSWCC